MKIDFLRKPQNTFYLISSSLSYIILRSSFFILHSPFSVLRSPFFVFYTYFYMTLIQLAEPYYAFKAAGFEVTIASTAGGACCVGNKSEGEDEVVETSLFGYTKNMSFKLTHDSLPSLTIDRSSTN